MKTTNILAVDEDQNILNLLNIVLSKQGWHVFNAKDGVEALRIVTENPPDLMILDLMIPKVDGFKILKQVRQLSQIPVIILSYSNDMENKVTCLNLGADDYITKPFGVDELLARIKAILPRDKIDVGIDIKQPFICDNIRIEYDKRRVFVSDNEVLLTHTEYSLLLELVTNSGKILTHSHLLKNIWGSDFSEETGYLHVYIGHLRAKLESDPKYPKHILNVSKVGYLFKT